MLSQNFFPLNKKWPELYEHAVKAEQYISLDPHAAIIKLRCYAELLVGVIYNNLSLYSVGTGSFYERLTDERFKQAVPSDVLAKLHGIRIWGNRAAHGEMIPAAEAGTLLKDAYLLGKWFYRSIERDENSYPEFLLPKHDLPANDKNNAVEKLTNQLEQALAELARLQSQERNASVFAEEEHDEYRLREFAQDSMQVAAQIDMESEATAKLFSLKDAFAEYELSQGQAALVEELDEFLKSKTKNVFSLQGYAGTGKTFITKGLTEYFKISGRNYILAAPTGKAAKVIATKANSPAYTIHKTIYSFKDIKEFSQEVDGSETYKFYAELAVNAHSADTVYIVDEASMISDKYQEAEFFRFGSGFLLRDFLKFVNLDHNDHRKKVIFIGDRAQLPPVGMNLSPALDENYLLKNYNLSVKLYTLTDVVRQKGDSGIIKNASMLRKLIDENCFNKLVMDHSLPGVQEIKYEEIVGAYFNACDERVNNNAILIAFSNADVAAYNRILRKSFLPGCGDDIYPGDKIMANNNNMFYGFFISNGDFGIVRKVIGKPEIHNVTIKRKNKDTKLVDEIAIALRFRNVELGFRDENGLSRFFDAKIIENLLYSEHAELSSDENKALYVDFCVRNAKLRRGSKEFKDTLKADPYFNAMRVKFGYAITCHKAQGSEWPHVFVKCKNSNTGLNSEYFRWLYTAITRASEYLYLIDPPEFKLAGGLKPIGLASLPPTSAAQVTALSPTVKAEEKAISLAGRPSGAPVVSGPGILPGSEAPPSAAYIAEKEPTGTFGLTDDFPFLLAILHKVRELITGTDISITAVNHHNDHEAYFFKLGTETARINLWYKANGTVSSVLAPTASSLGLRLVSLLGPLKGISFVTAQQIQQLDFSMQFLRDFYDEVVNIVSGHGISVQNVEPIQYAQRYTFVRGSEVAKFDIWYNDKKQFTKLSSLKNFQSHPELVYDVSRLLTNIG